MRLKRVASIVGVDDVCNFEWSYRPPTAEELSFFRTETALCIGRATRWPIHRPDLSAENIIAKTLALESTLAVAELASDSQ